MTTAVVVRARHEAVVAGGVGQRADVRLVGVAGDDLVDLGAHLGGDLGDRRGDAVATVDGAGLVAALVQEHDDGLDALLLSSFAWAFAVLTSSRKSTLETPAGLTRVGVASSVMPMKPILAPLIFLMDVPGSSVLPLSLRTTLAESHWKSAPA